MAISVWTVRAQTRYRPRHASPSQP